jgi:hypothetical protein
MMYPAHLAIAGLHALRDSIGVITRARIPIGRDGYNRPRPQRGHKEEASSNMPPKYIESAHNYCGLNDVALILD